MTGKTLLRLLEADGWESVRRNPHGVWLRKQIEGRTRFTTVKDTREDIPQTTLSQILGPKQTGLGREGLKALEEKHGA